MSNKIEKFQRYLGKPIAVIISDIDGAEDTFHFKPLNIGQQALLMEVSKSIQNHGVIEMDIEEDGKMIKKSVPNVTKDDLNAMLEIILDVVKGSYPELDDDMLNDFCNTNFEQLSGALTTLTPGNNSKDVSSLKKAQEAIQRGQTDK